MSRLRPRHFLWWAQSRDQDFHLHGLDVETETETLNFEIETQLKIVKTIRDETDK